jgi:hypothetical protein
MEKAPTRRTNQMQICLCFLLQFYRKEAYHLSIRSQIKAKARSIPQTFIAESTCELPPLPLEDKIAMFYILISEIDIVMDRKILEKPENTLALLIKLEIDGTLGNLFVSTFDPWYLYPLMSTLQLLNLFWFIICSSFVYFLLVAHPTSWWKD